MQYLQTRKFGTETVALGSWRGDTRQKWTGTALCRGVFDLLVKMKGEPTRIRLLRMLSEPKHKLQLANGAGIYWKAVDRHMQRLPEYSLVDVVAVAGTCKIYLITEKGRRALVPLERGADCS